MNDHSRARSARVLVAIATRIAIEREQRGVGDGPSGCLRAVSTDDQVDYSPDAQAARCRDYARLHGVGALELIKDEGFSGKNLERPGMRRSLRLSMTISSPISWCGASIGSRETWAT